MGYLQVFEIVENYKLVEQIEGRQKWRGSIRIKMAIFIKSRYKELIKLEMILAKVGLRLVISFEYIDVS